MYLTKEQTLSYAAEVADKLGKWCNVRDVVFGGTESSYREFDGYGLYITVDDGSTDIRFNGVKVFGNSTFNGGKWELVLEEVYKSIPKILEQREAEKKRTKEDEQLVEDCKKYVLHWEHHPGMGGSWDEGYYGDDVIHIRVVTDHPFCIYERHTSGNWIFKKTHSTLVFTTGNDPVEPNDGLWRDYVNYLIYEGKKRADEQKKASGIAKMLESEQKASRYLDELRRM